MHRDIGRVGALGRSERGLVQQQRISTSPVEHHDCGERNQRKFQCYGIRSRFHPDRQFEGERRRHYIHVCTATQWLREQRR